MIRSTLRRLCLAVVATLLPLATVVVGAAPAHAALPAPGALAPTATGVSGIPTLSWSRVSGASGYSVEVATSSSFSQTVWRTDTANRFAVPTEHMPNTADSRIYWRVRAYDGSGPGTWATTSFTRSALAGPALVSPVDNASLVQPTDPAMLSWSPVDGAVSYTVEVDTESQFIDPVTSRTDTQSTSWVMPDPAIATTYYWRVTANLNSAKTAVSEPSETHRFRIAGLTKPILVAPVDNVDASVTGGDVNLQWQPVPGAARYNVQVSTDINFPTNGETRTVTNVTGTSYSPPVTYGNDQYYWRVQPVDNAGHQLDWSQVDVWHFQRSWPEQPTLEHPAINSTTVGQAGDGLFYQWTGVRHAAWYRLQLSLTSTFNTIYMQCDTKQTTFVPGGDNCRPQSLETVYWRVIAYDNDCSLSCAETPHTDGISSPVGRFTFSPTLVGLTSPTSGTAWSATDVPVFTWQSADNTARYRITITNVSSNAVYERDTTALSFVPRDLLGPGTYRWQVRTISETGRVGPGVLQGYQPTFTITGAYAPASTGAAPTPTNSPAPATRMPLLTWTPVGTATYYRVLVRAHGTLLYHYLDGNFAYPAAVYDGIQATGYDLLGPDTYDWMVEAYAGSSFVSDSGGIPGSYQIVSPSSVTGERAALTGTALGSDSTSCVAALPAKCVDLRQSPVLSWDPVPDAGSYVVYISRDKEMTNIISQYTTTTQQNMWTSPELLPDSQAGAAYYWSVKPCIAGQACAALEHADHAFNKLSNQVALLGETTRDAITLTWDDYLTTNGDGVSGHQDATGVASRQEAAKYQVQVSTVPNFESTIDDISVDQLTYTAFDKTYPEGPLYWRVRAWDGSNNPLAWSDPRQFQKSSDHPRLLTPTAGATVGGTQAFRWQPMDYASSYDVEVYRGLDTIGQPANRVGSASGNSRQVAFTPTSALPPGQYSWRVRRIDSGNRVGPWSPLDPVELGSGELRGLFQVNSAVAPQLAPAAGATVNGNEAVFTWQVAPGAAYYRWKRRDTVGNVVSTMDTRALGWAATDVIPAGSWQWSVTTFDANGQELGTSSWRTFVVAGSTGGTSGTGGTGGTGTGGTGTGGTGAADRTRPRVLRFSPVAGSSVKRTTSFTVVFSEPVTRVSSTTVKLTLGGTKVRATLTLSRDGRTVVLKPSRRLKASKRYVVAVTTGVRDRAGNALVAASATFRTKR